MLGDSVAVVLCCMCRLAYGGYVAVAFTPGSFGPRLFGPQPGKGHPAIVWIHITAINCTADGGFGITHMRVHIPFFRTLAGGETSHAGELWLGV
jgi:hypothetical protein